MVDVRKVARDRWVATIRSPRIVEEVGDVVGEGKGPLSAVHDLFAKLRDRGLSVVEEGSSLTSGR